MNNLMGKIQKEKNNNIFTVLLTFLLLGQNTHSQGNLWQKMLLGAYSFEGWVHDLCGGKYGSRQKWHWSSSWEPNFDPQVQNRERPANWEWYGFFETLNPILPDTVPRTRPRLPILPKLFQLLSSKHSSIWTYRDILLKPPQSLQ